MKFCLGPSGPMPREEISLRQKNLTPMPSTLKKDSLKKDSHLEQQRRLSPSPRRSLLDRHSSRDSDRSLAADHHRSPAAPTHSPESLDNAASPRLQSLTLAPAGPLSGPCQMMHRLPARSPFPQWRSTTSSSPAARTRSVRGHPTTRCGHEETEALLSRVLLHDQQRPGRLLRRGQGQQVGHLAYPSSLPTPRDQQILQDRCPRLCENTVLIR
jgi:hypothetical protein